MKTIKSAKISVLRTQLKIGKLQMRMTLKKKLEMTLKIRNLNQLTSKKTMNKMTAKKNPAKKRRHRQKFLS